jgi:hypothetical protein
MTRSIEILRSDQPLVECGRADRDREARKAGIPPRRRRDSSREAAGLRASKISDSSTVLKFGCFSSAGAHRRLRASKISDSSTKIRLLVKRRCSPIEPVGRIVLALLEAELGAEEEAEAEEEAALPSSCWPTERLQLRGCVYCAGAFAQQAGERDGGRGGRQ